MSACVDQPVSWLALERHALGELREDEARALEEHLARCPVCRSCQAQIAQDVRELPPLLPLPAAERRPRRQGSRAAWWALAGACAATLLMLRSVRHVDAPVHVQQVGVKGAEVAVEVVRQDAAGRLLEPVRFAAEDRFKLRVTCPPGLRGPVRVLIFQAGQVFEPVPAQDVRCGNGVSLAGAWRMDGTQAVEMCAVFGAEVAPSDVQALAALGLPHACARLEPQ